MMCAIEKQLLTFFLVFNLDRSMKLASARAYTLAYTTIFSKYDNISQIDWSNKLKTELDIMQRRRVSRIGVVLFLFIFGFVCFRTGLGVGVVYYPFRGFDPTGAIHLSLTVIGALCLILAVYLVKKRWF